LCSLAGFSPPPLVESTLTLVDQGASGKLLLQPLLTAYLALPLLDGAQGRVAVMLMAVPSGAFSVLFAVRYGVASAQIGTMLIASTLLRTVRHADGGHPAVVRLEVGLIKT
jgi:malonate transporter and related proteins